MYDLVKKKKKVVLRKKKHFSVFESKRDYVKMNAHVRKC